MIGQEFTKNQLRHTFTGVKPKFSLLVGERGSGKKTILQEVFGNKAVYVMPVNDKSITVDQIRSLIVMANNMYDTLFILPDIDKISTNAQNALLKIIEEPPNNNCFIATVSNVDAVLPTIKSRATIMYMDYYSRSELIEVVHEVLGKDYQYIADQIVDICDTPGEVIEVCNYGVAEFFEYVKKLHDNLPNAGWTNSFKAAEKIALKADSNGYNLELVWKAYKRVCRIRLMDYLNDDYFENYSPEADLKYIQITNKCLNALRTTGVNKSMLFGAWVVEVLNVAV